MPVFDFNYGLKQQYISRKSFTLIELLVVLVIISILCTLILPSLARAREKAKVAVCLNNLSQTGKFTSLYFKNNDGKFPPFHGSTIWYWFGKTGSAAIGATNWRARNRPLNKYISSRQFSDSEEVKVAHCPSDDINLYNVAGSSYGANSGVETTPIANINRYPNSISYIEEVRESSRFILVSEAKTIRNHLNYITWWNAGYHPFGKDLAVFADGHAKSFKISAGVNHTQDYTIDNRY